MPKLRSYSSRDKVNWPALQVVIFIFGTGVLVSSYLKFSLSKNFPDNPRTACFVKGAIVPATCWRETVETFQPNQDLDSFAVPILGVAVINRGDLLKRLIYSIDVPVHKIVIVHNVYSGGPEAADLKEAIEYIVRVFGSGHIRVLSSNTNLGCGPSWNLVMRTFPAKYWLIVNSDVAFNPGQIRDFVDPVVAQPKTLVLGTGEWSFRMFVISVFVFNEVGAFDENLWPAYVEDCDFLLRVRLHRDIRIVHKAPRHIHGDNGVGSAILTFSREEARKFQFRERNSLTHMNNFIYWRYKWGLPANFTECQSPEVLENISFRTPYNDTTLDINGWRFFPRERALSETIWDFDRNIISDRTCVDAEYGKDILGVSKGNFNSLQFPRPEAYAC